MSMLDNWEKTSFSEKRRYYTKNESGSFYCDEDGALIWFEAAEKNQLSQPPFGFGSFVPKRCMKTLRLPEGLRTIGEEELRDLIIVEKLTFPATIEKLEAGVLSGCLIMEMELPETLREIGPGALMCDYIHVLRIPKGMLHPQLPIGWEQKKVEGTLTIYGRQFKETIINTLIVPRNYPYRQLMVETKINNIVYSD